VDPKRDARPFLREDGSIRLLDALEFSLLSNLDKAEYLERISKELQKSIEQLGEMVARRDAEMKSLVDEAQRP
jgi:hypothetical protein